MNGLHFEIWYNDLMKIYRCKAITKLSCKQNGTYCSNAPPSPSPPPPPPLQTINQKNNKKTNKPKPKTNKQTKNNAPKTTCFHFYSLLSYFYLVSWPQHNLLYTGEEKLIVVDSIPREHVVNERFC